MRFKPKYKPRPTRDDTKTRKRFAWFPVRTDNGEWIWLEQYTQVRKYNPRYGWFTLNRF